MTTGRINQVAVFSAGFHPEGLYSKPRAHRGLRSRQDLRTEARSYNRQRKRHNVTPPSILQVSGDLEHLDPEDSGERLPSCQSRVRISTSATSQVTAWNCVQGSLFNHQTLLCGSSLTEKTARPHPSQFHFEHPGRHHTASSDSTSAWDGVRQGFQGRRICRVGCSEELGHSHKQGPGSFGALGLAAATNSGGAARRLARPNTDAP